MYGPSFLGRSVSISQIFRTATGRSWHPPLFRMSRNPEELAMIAGMSLRARRLWTDVRGVAATEFAVIVPFMLVLYVGGVELGNGLAMNVKVSSTAHAVGDMVSQNTAISTARMQ